MAGHAERWIPRPSKKSRGFRECVIDSPDAAPGRHRMSSVVAERFSAICTGYRFREPEIGESTLEGP